MHKIKSTTRTLNEVWLGGQRKVTWYWLAGGETPQWIGQQRPDSSFVVVYLNSDLWPCTSHTDMIEVSAVTTQHCSEPEEAQRLGDSVTRWLGGNLHPTACRIKSECLDNIAPVCPNYSTRELHNKQHGSPQLRWSAMTLSPERISLKRQRHDAEDVFFFLPGVSALFSSEIFSHF